jgi:cell division control protein 6
MKRDMLMWDETLFKNRELFELDYVPEHFAHRESQMNSLMFCARPALQGARPVNALCLGPPGTGKTTAIIKLFEEIEKHSKKVVPIYVNCQMDYTKYAVFYQIFKKIFEHSPPSSGVSFKRLFEKVARHSAEKKTVLLVALDDINYLFQEKEVDRVLYSLLRAHETFPGARIGVIAIISEPALQYIFDPRVTSVFQAEEITFPLYTRQEIYDILSRRAQLGFYPGVISNEILDKITGYTENAGDLRVGIDLLRRAGLETERRALRTISEEDVDSSYEKSRLVHLTYALRSLKKDELVLLRQVAEVETTKAGELYKKFHDQTGSGYTRFHEILNKLDAVRLISTDFSGPGSRGRSRIIKIRYDPKEILNRIDI